jgi:hypothetical protein
MGTRKTNQTAETLDCAICGQTYSASCDYRQGRCPHHPPLIKGNIMNHLNVSLVKSALRLVACYFLAYYDVQLAAILLGLAEVLGVAEELV